MLKRNVMVGCGLMLAIGSEFALAGTELKTDRDRLSYSIGTSIGKNLRAEKTDVDVNLLIEGMKASLAGDKPLLPEAEVRKVMNDYQTQMRQRNVASKQLAMGENKKKGDAFLADYKTQTGAMSLPSGVLYKVMKEGTGRKPIESDMVAVHYRGTLINGTEFDSTETGRPANLKISSLIVGWKQALAMMPTGSKWQIVIPSQLAYGERGVGNDIGPNEVLVFDLELVAIN